MRQPHRVAIDAVALGPGGGLTYLVNQAQRFEADPEWEFTYFVSPRSQPSMAQLVPGRRLRVPFSTSPSLPARLRWEQISLPRILRREGFDALYAPGGFAVFRSSVPQLVVDHNPYHHAGRAELGVSRALVRFRMERALARWSARRAESVVYLSQAFATAMQRHRFPAPDAIVPSGVSTDWPTEMDPAQWPLECEACSSGGFALAVHNWAPGKGIDWLIRAWPSTGDARHLVVVGRPLDRSTERRVRAALSEPGAAARVHPLTLVGRDVIAELYRRASVYLSASTLEAFPLTPFEAMSFGIPCVLSDIPEHREVAGDAAAYFPVGDAGGLRAALDHSSRCRDDLVGRGRAVTAEMTWDYSASRIMQLLAGLIRSEGGTAPGRSETPIERV